MAGKRPLYKAVALEKRPPGANLGLWYDKFPPMQAGEEGRWKQDWIEEAAGKITDPLIGECAGRQADMVLSLGGRVWVFEAESRFVTGLGRSHPVENGFAWHWTLGAPYLPGSSVKGVVNAWLREESSDEKERRQRLFGTFQSVGSVCFLDALPYGGAVLEADVLTPHYAGWTPDNPPGDWRSPTPVFFLTVGAGARFLFAALPAQAAEFSESDWSFVGQGLEEALLQAGAGAKTSSGYGRMKLDNRETDKLSRHFKRKQYEAAEAQRLREMPPVEREMEELIRNKPNKDEPDYRVLLTAFEQDRWKDREGRRAVILRIRKEMEESGNWKPFGGKKLPKNLNKLKANARNTMKVQEILRGLGEPDT